MATYETLRWGDRLLLATVVGQSIRTPELIRVEAPFPTVWRVMGVVEAADPGLSCRLTLLVGIGSTTKPYLFATPLSSTFSFEIPGQNIGAFWETSVAAVAGPLLLDIAIAPLVPWEGLKVIAR